jgi:WD40 repeat protein
MKSKLTLYLIVAISIAIINILACGIIPPTAAIPSSEPTLTLLPATPTVTLIPPTDTPSQPTPTATPEIVIINADNVQDISTRFEFPIPEDSVRAVAFSPDSKLIAAGTGMNLSSPDQKVRIWNVETGRIIAESEKLHTIIWDIVFTPDGTMIAVALDNATIQLRSVDDLSIVDRLEQPGAVNSLSISPDGKRLAAGVADADGDGGVVYVWDIDSHELLLEFWAHPYSVPSMDFSLDGSLLATGAVDRSVKVWNSQTGNLIQTLPQNGQGTTVKFSPDGSFLASGLCSESISLDCQKGSIMLWDLASWQISKILTGPNDWVDGVAFSPNTDILVGASRDGFIYFWRLSDGILLHTIGAHSSGVEAVSFSSDGNFIASGSFGSAKIWSVDR